MPLWAELSQFPPFRILFRSINNKIIGNYNKIWHSAKRPTHISEFNISEFIHSTRFMTMRFWSDWLFDSSNHNKKLKLVTLLILKVYWIIEYFHNLFRSKSSKTIAICSIANAIIVTSFGAALRTYWRVLVTWGTILHELCIVCCKKFKIIKSLFCFFVF